MEYNHKLEEVKVKYSVRPGSRNRIRIPVFGMFISGMTPSSRVSITGYKNVCIVPDKRGKYIVEKDGSIRFSARKYGIFSDTVNVINNIHNIRVE